ncbi:MAG: glycogen synthase GlgA [Myxococcota bacterium]
MKLLFLASEVAPFSKTGGLADVCAALPAALAARGHQVTVVTPLYGSVKEPSLRPVGEPFTLRFPFGPVTGSLQKTRVGKNHEVLFIDQRDYFGGREGLYGEGEREYGDNHRRFAFFAMAALNAAQQLELSPQILHLNDWQTGLAAVALRTGFSGSPLLSAKSVFTIHNLAYQGTFHKSVMDELGLPWELFTANGVEFYDQVSFLKAGLAFGDALTTVSKKYAQEILTPEGGQGLDGYLRDRAKSLTGILNGVDYAEWNPAKDPATPQGFSAKDLSGKATCKKELLSRFGLPLDKGEKGSALLGVVSRLAVQKGVELLLGALPWLLERDVKVVVLGSGEPSFEQALRELKARYPARLGVKIGFDSALAHLVEAGSDFFLMPSLFEPCGLNQMYSLRYGAVPVVRATGGLDDTVVDLSQPKPTGIKFVDYSVPAFVGALRRALELYADTKRLFEVRRRGMAVDFSWSRSAAEYEALYLRLLEGQGAG